MLENNLSYERTNRRSFLGTLGLVAASGLVMDKYILAEEVDYHKSQNAFKKGIIVNPKFNIGLFLCRDIKNKDFKRLDNYNLDDFKDINRNGRLVSENGTISYLDYPIYNRNEELFVVVYNPERNDHNLRLDVSKRNEKELSMNEAKDIKENLKKDYPEILNQYPYLKSIMNKDEFSEDEATMINRIIRHEFTSGSGFWGIGKSGKIVEYDWKMIFETDSFNLKEHHKLFPFKEKYFENGVYLASFDVVHKGVNNIAVTQLPFVISS